jgi:hypothetical protein
MPRLWEKETETREEWGSFQVIIGDRDVTYFRDAPTIVSSWSSADPFDDSSAELSFPQITPLDALGVGDLHWLRDWANVDIYLVRPDTSKVKLWEGLVVDFDFTSESLTVTCLGALYQLDLYVAQPRHYTFDQLKQHEELIADQFQPRADRPHLRLAPLRVDFPVDWDIQNKQGENITGRESRNTGEWDSVLTGYIQEMLTLMMLKDGRQWTLMKDEGRQPVLRLKDPRAEPKWTISMSAQGVEASLKRDLMQAVNVIYGQGEDEGGTVWRGARIRMVDGHPVTFYEPLAHDRRALPTKENPAFDPDIVITESFYNFGPFVTRLEADRESAMMLARDRDPGWFGSITLTIDPEEGSRFEIKAGDNIRLRHFGKSKEDGLIFHVASCQADIQSGQVSLTVDTKARDLLTLSEIIARNRDAKTPHRLLQVNRRSHIAEDRYQPWDYTAGSGFIPTPSLEMGHQNVDFPWTEFTQQFPPRSHPEFYTFVNGSSPNHRDRWTAVEIVASERINIRQTEIVAVNQNGTPIAIPFHVSMHAFRVWADDMPWDDDGNPDPFTPEAFDSTSDDGFKHPPPSLIIGWGDDDQRAGFWPGLESDGDPATGMLRDESTWSHQLDRAEYHLWVMFYATTDVWFIGRLFQTVE